MGGDVKDKGPPEQLVLGAKLKCWYGSVCSYLIVLDFNRQLKYGLPMACVTDSKVSLNITPFGRCLNGGPCECLIGLSDEWTNPEPQNEDINGKQIITTHSFIICDKQGGMFIEPQDSGQDGVFAEQIVFLSQMEHDYPGLLAFLMDPNASVYLTDGMLDKVLDFLGDCITRQGDSIWLAGLDPVNNLVDPYILAALSHITFANVSDTYDRLTGMENEITKSGLNNDADSQFLNKALLDVIRKNTSEHAQKVVEGGGFYKWQEEHKALISFVGDSMMSMAYAMVIWGSAQGYASRQGTYSSMDADIRDAEIGQNNRTYTNQDMLQGSSRPVDIKPPLNATPEQIAQLKSYVDGCNDALRDGALSSTGRVSTKGVLRTQASASAAAERARAAAAGTPYIGHAGHVPDTTWTGTADPHSWLDLDPTVNMSIGGQANAYPIGYKPTEFRYSGGN